MLTLLRFLLLFTFGAQLWAADAASYTWYTVGANKQATINVELFLSSTCPHCHKADAFFRVIEPQMPWLHVNRNYINESKEALILFNQFLTQLKFNDFAVPSAFFCNSRWVGFDTAETTGKDLLKALEYCKQQIEKNGTLSEASINVMKRWANANMFNSGVTEQPSTFQYLLIVALLDVTNPCGLLCFSGFLAVLFIQHSKKNQWISGLLFVAAITIIHYIQQTQANVFFHVLPWLRIVAVAIGLCSLYIAFMYYKQRPLKPYLLFIWAFFLALIVQSYQQTCVMNWSYIFEQWLYNQQLYSGQKAVLQLIYQAFYIIPLILILLIYMLIEKLKFMVSIKPFLELVGLLFISIIALFLIIMPMAMAQYLMTFMILLSAVIGGVFLNRYKIKNKDY